LEGESLVNDASALVLYRLAIGALTSGTFSLAEAGLEFIYIASGGVLIGFLLGMVVQRFSRLLDPVVGVVFSFTIPYATYILANALGTSGVLAVVVNGLLGSRTLLLHQSSLRRVLGHVAWDIFIILMNCFVFILIGLQLRALIEGMTFAQTMQYTFYGFVFTLATMVVRTIWVFARSGWIYWKNKRNPRFSLIQPQIFSDALIISWSGMRGIVSLAAVLALPYTQYQGVPLEGRSEVIFITFIVILMTLLFPGFTLAPLIRWLHIRPHYEYFGARRVRKQLAKAAEEKLTELHASGILNAEELDFLKQYFDMQHKVLEISTTVHKKLQHIEQARLLVIHAQRKSLIEIWQRLEIDDKLLDYLEHELDVEETRIARAAL
jgi:CPA1 family monovalent cation:H+ antiporter